MDVPQHSKKSKEYAHTINTKIKAISKSARRYVLDPSRFTTKIIACKTIRNRDGLALSSRNQLIPSENKKVASKFYHCLRSSKSSEEVKIELNNIGFDVDYIEEHDGRRFGAIKLGQVRLIDNVKI